MTLLADFTKLRPGETVMKKSLIIISSILLLSFLAVNVSADEQITIVCSNSILADFTSNLVTENVTIDYIMPSGVCPAFYDTCPSDVSKIVNADIIISFGSTSMEPWLSDLLAYNEDCSIIECKDLGEWNIPSGARAYVECLNSKLSEVLPELNETISANTQSYLAEIDNKSEELKQIIETSGYLGKKIICMGWQKDFIEWLGLNVTYSYGPPQGLSVQDELDVISAASSGDVYAVVDNLQSGTDFGAKVASESGATHVIFTNFPGAIPGTDTYLEMISYNTDQLVDGLKTHEYKKGDIANLEDQVSSLEFQRKLSIVFVIIFVILSLIFYLMYKKK